MINYGSIPELYLAEDGEDADAPREDEQDTAEEPDVRYGVDDGFPLEIRFLSL